MQHDMTVVALDGTQAPDVSTLDKSLETLDESLEDAIDLDGDGKVDEGEFKDLDKHQDNPISYGAEIVEISGVLLYHVAEARPYAGINGNYQRQGEVANGLAVYAKTSNPDTAMWWANNEGALSWVIGRKADVGTSKMLCVSV